MVLDVPLPWHLSQASKQGHSRDSHLQQTRPTLGGQEMERDVVLVWGSWLQGLEDWEDRQDVQSPTVASVLLRSAPHRTPGSWPGCLWRPDNPFLL